MDPDPQIFNDHSKVLVLNATYIAINICSWKRAMALLFKDKAESLEKSGRLINNKFVLPFVIRLRHYVPAPLNGLTLTRKNIFLRDNFTCQYCGKDGNLTIDHVIPKSRGGVDSWSNTVVCCVRCNNKKGDKMPDEADMKLLSTPYKPPSMLYLHMTRLSHIPKVWHEYFFSKALLN